MKPVKGLVIKIPYFWKYIEVLTEIGCERDGFDEKYQACQLTLLCNSLENSRSKTHKHAYAENACSKREYYCILLQLDCTEQGIIRKAA